MALELNGTTGVSLVQDGVVTAADLASTLDLSGKTISGVSGTRLQSVSITYSGYEQTTSGTYSNTGLTLSITPSSTSSKILVLADVQVMAYTSSGSAADGYGRLYNSTRSVDHIEHYLQVHDYGGSGSISDRATPYNWLDSPNSTATQTYVYQHRINSGMGFRINNGGASQMILMEIAG